MKPVALGWLTGVLVILLIAPAQAELNCALPETVICNKLPPHEVVSCVKHVQIAVGVCRRATRTERFGSHEDHCRVACETGFRFFDLDRRLREDIPRIVRDRGAGDEDWRQGALAFWSEQGRSVCSDEQLEEAEKSCLKSCQTDAARRDLKELQSLAKGGSFLALEYPEYACRPSAALELLSRDERSGLEWLYPPGHAARGD